MPPAARTAAILAAITFAVFTPTLSSGFVYDARLQILTDPFPHDPRNWPAVLSFAVLGMDVLDFNRPVHLASIMLDATLWGKDPVGYHLTSILLHCANVVLLWLVLRDVLPRKPDDASPGHTPAAATASASTLPILGGFTATAADVAAFAGALLFGVHPLVTEAVCEPTFREDLLVAAFTLGALVLAGRHAPNGAAPRAGMPRGDSRRAVGIAACCLLSCASKESGIATPVVLAAYWWLFRRGKPGRFWAAAIGGGGALAAAFMAARFLLEPAQSVIFESKPAYPGGSFLTAMQFLPRILALYAQLVVWPANLCADYGSASVGHLPLPLALLILGLLAAGLGWAGWHDRRIAFGAALMLLPLLPVSNLLPIYRAAADRYCYVPLAGVAVIAACLVDRAWTRLPKSRRQAGLVGGSAVLVVLAAVCIERQRVWADSLALWLDTARRNPTSYSAATGLATAFCEAGRFTDAETAARHALTLTGGTRGDTWVALARTLDGQGRTAEADEAITEALERDPRLADPDQRVAALAMERSEAAALAALLARRPRDPAAKPDDAP